MRDLHHPKALGTHPLSLFLFPFLPDFPHLCRYITWTLTIAPQTLHHRTGTRVTQGEGVNQVEGTLQSTLNGSTTTTTTVVVLTSLEVTLSALKDVVLHADVEIGGAATTVVLPKASVTQVTSSTTSSVAAPFDCAVAAVATCHMQGSFRLSLDLARQDVVGGGNRRMATMEFNTVVVIPTHARILPPW